MSIRSVEAVLHTLGQGAPDKAGRSGGHGFITLTRQAGAGAAELADRLVEAFNAHGQSPPWRVYDRELIERVAKDHNLPKWVVEQVGERSHSWFEDIATGFNFEHPRPPDEAIYMKVAATVRALANQGHAVFVGRGASFCTQDLPGGLHVRLVAPIADRVKRVMRRRDLGLEQAERWVRDTDRHREAFLRRFWPYESRQCEHFSVVLNTARVSPELQVSIISMLVAQEPVVSV